MKELGMLPGEGRSPEVEKRTGWSPEPREEGHSAGMS